MRPQANIFPSYSGTADIVLAMFSAVPILFVMKYEIRSTL